MPQTLETLALDTARRTNKLDALWEKVMEKVPVDRRLKRNWFGERYIRSMIEDLHSRPNDSASWALNSLLDFYNDPNFDEPWD